MSEHTYLTNNHNCLKQLATELLKASEAFSRDSNYEFDFMLWIKGQVLKSCQVQLFKHYYSNILNFLMILICLYAKNAEEVQTFLARHILNINLW